MTMSLKDKQRNLVFRMLNFNKDLDSENIGGWSDQWKILVYDNHCRDIISTLANVSQLRKQGVTLHLLIDSDREPIPDVPAIYFCTPTPENIKRIANDLSRRLYVSVHINFSTKIERHLLENLAEQALLSGGVNAINKIYDQYIHYVTLETSLFSLNRPNSFLSYNNPKVRDDEIEKVMRSITYGIFSVLVTLGAVPVIRTGSGGPGQMIAEQLNKLIGDHIGSGGGLFSSNRGVVQQRPLLVIFDRSVDLVTPLRHSSTYQALLDDVLDHRVNRVTVSIEEKAGGPVKKKTYDVDSESDIFYKQYKGASFPDAIEANGTELAAVTQQEDDIRRRTGAMGINVDSDTALAALSGNESNTRDLAQAVESLPKLLEQKKGLEMHTNILKAIMDSVANRQIPLYFEAEEEMITTARADKGALVNLLGTSGKGSLNDKLRLLSLYCLATRPTPKDLSELEKLLRDCCKSPAEIHEVEQGLKSVSYLREQVGLQHLPTFQQLPASNSELKGPKYLQGLLAKAQTQATGLLVKAAATAGQLLSRANKTYVTKVVESILDHGEEHESYLYYDPRMKINGRNLEEPIQLRTVPHNVIVFMVGGGCYTEFQNLQDFAQRRSASSGSTVRVIYGCTELLNAERFMTQLAALSKH